MVVRFIDVGTEAYDDRRLLVLSPSPFYGIVTQIAIQRNNLKSNLFLIIKKLHVTYFEIGCLVTLLERLFT